MHSDQQKATPSKAVASVVSPGAKQETKEFRLETQAVFLAYQGLAAALDLALACWARFLEFLKGHEMLYTPPSPP